MTEAKTRPRIEPLPSFVFYSYTVYRQVLMILIILIICPVTLKYITLPVFPLED